MPECQRQLGRCMRDVQAENSSQLRRMAVLLSPATLAALP